MAEGKKRSWMGMGCLTIATVFFGVVLLFCLVGVSVLYFAEGYIPGPTRLVAGPEGSVSVYVNDFILRADAKGRLLEAMEVGSRLGMGGFFLGDKPTSVLGTKGEVMDFAYTNDGSLILATERNPTLALFDKNRTSKGALKLKCPRSQADGDVHCGFSVSPQTGNLYFSDTLAGTVTIYGPDYAKIGALTPPRAFNWPTHILISEGEGVFVSDQNNFRLVSFVNGTSYKAEYPKVPEPADMALVGDTLYVISNNSLSGKSELRAVPLDGREQYTPPVPSEVGSARPRGILPYEGALLVTYSNDYHVYRIGTDGSFLGYFGDEGFQKAMDSSRDVLKIFKFARYFYLALAIITIGILFYLSRKFRTYTVDMHIKSVGEEFYIDEIGDGNPLAAPPAPKAPKAPKSPKSPLH